MIQVDAQITGAKEAIIALRKIDPEYRKDFNRDAKQIAAPLVNAAKAAYPQMPLSRMSKAWVQNGRELLPWVASKVRSGVKLKTSTRRNQASVIYITQSNPAGAIFDIAGQANPGKTFNKNLRNKHPRVLWPTADRHLPEVQRGIQKLVHDVMDKVDREIR